MDREWLEAQLAERMSLARIAALAGRSPSTVSYWLGKFDLEASGSSKFGADAPIDAAPLAALVAQGLSVPEIAFELDRSRDVVRRALRRHGLVTRSTSNRRKAKAAAERGVRKVELECRHHGLTEHVLEGALRYRCMRCRGQQVSEHRRKIKRTLIAEAGGACVVCGYSRCEAALQFHHLDRAAKAFHLSLRGVTRSWAEVRAEAAKCVLLCATCHAEVEIGYTRIPAELTATKTPRGGLEPPNLD